MTNAIIICYDMAIDWALAEIERGDVKVVTFDEFEKQIEDIKNDN